MHSLTMSFAASLAPHAKISNHLRGDGQNLSKHVTWIQATEITIAIVQPQGYT